MSETDLEEFGRRRLLQLCEWREILAHGSDEEKRALVAGLRPIDLEPVLSVLDEDEDEVRLTASRVRTKLALAELRRKEEEAVSARDFETAATYMDLRLSIEDADYRDNAGRL